MFCYHVCEEYSTREKVLIFFFSPYVTRRTSYVALPSRVRLHEAKGAFFESHPVSRGPVRSCNRRAASPRRHSLSFSLPLVRSHARSLARSFGSRRPSACNFAPHLAAPIHRHQYFVIVRNGSGADRWLRCVSLSLSLVRSSYFSCCPVPFLARVSRLFGGGASTLVLRRRLQRLWTFFLSSPWALSAALSLAPAGTQPVLRSFSAHSPRKPHARTKETA